MDQRDFDALTRTLVEVGHGRRGLLRTLLAGIGAALAAHGPGAATKERPAKTKRRRGKDAAGRNRQSRAKQRGALGAQAGGEDQPPNCTPGGQFCDDSAECCTGLCCGHKCCYDGTSPHVACCTATSGKEFCTVLTTSESHCGKCGNKCQPGAECKNGTCIHKPAEPCLKCEPDEVCDDGRCVKCDCPYGQVCKDGACILDPQCAVPNGCPWTNIYDESRCCGEQCCPWDSRCCGGACCEYPRECIDGRCVCPRQQQCGDVCCDTGETCCQGVCISGYGVNRDHCGACGNACAPDEVCCDLTGYLEDQRCLTPRECCTAYSRQTEEAWSVCGDGLGFNTCCPEETSCCGGDCIGVNSTDLCCDGLWAHPGDRAHCGACGSVCKPNEVCCYLGYNQHDYELFGCHDHATCCELQSDLYDKKYVPCGTGDDRECCEAGGTPCHEGGCDEAATGQQQRRRGGKDAGKRAGRSAPNAAKSHRSPHGHGKATRQPRGRNRTRRDAGH